MRTTLVQYASKGTGMSHQRRCPLCNRVAGPPPPGEQAGERDGEHSERDPAERLHSGALAVQAESALHVVSEGKGLEAVGTKENE
mmetsp:Transcript_85623/g.170991  ORF Transcript_85623/g.170991 Transcript_85623/m.170991 type:complete len:85 (+) Transcript_85623:56-310(+)